jgi:hypothetical protein
MPSSKGSKPLSSPLTVCLVLHEQLPKVGGDDGKWIYDRIMVVECPNVIPKDKQDKNFLICCTPSVMDVYKAVKLCRRLLPMATVFPERIPSARRVTPFE